MKSEKKFITEVILRMADFDYGGVLFHARYLEILDYVRNNIFSDINGSAFQLLSKDLALAVVDYHLIYRRSIKNINLLVSTEVLEVKDKSIKIEHKIMENSNQRRIDLEKQLSEEPFFKATVSLVCVNLKEKRATGLPQNFKEKLAIQ